MDDPILNTATPDSVPAVPTNEPTPAPAEPRPQEPTAADNGGAPEADNTPILDTGDDPQNQNEMVGAPESYEDFSIPENFALDENGKAEAVELFKKLNLSQKGAQSLIDAYAEKLTAAKEAELNQLAEQRKAWRSEIRNNPNYASDRATALKGLRAVVQTPEEKALFQDSWLSDHPALFSMFVKVGRLIGEDSPIPGGKGAPETDNINLTRFPIK